MAKCSPAPVPFVDLGAHHRAFSRDFQAKLKAVLASSEFVLGGELEAFERQFAAYIGTRHAVGVASGTDALRLACEAINLRPGDEVVVPAHTYVATALGVTHAGGFPRFVDVTPDTFTLDPDRLEAALTPRTRAVIPVHLYGQPADMGAILDVARRNGLRVIEDVAQAHGAAYRGRRAGGLGDLGCFSFYPSKNLGALGDGGMVTTNDDALADRVRVLRNMGQRRKYEHVELGGNSRLDNLQAAFLQVKLPRLDANNRRRQTAAKRYARALEGSDARCPVVGQDRTHVYHLYAILHPRRDEVMARLRAAGIGCGVYYPTLVPFQPCYRELGYRPGDFPRAQEIVDRSLALPMFPELTERQIQSVARQIRGV